METKTRRLNLILVMLPLGLLGCGHTNVTQPHGATAAYTAIDREKSVFPWPEGIKTAISLTFDDARASQVEVAIPILNAHQVRGTFYVSLAGVEARTPAWKAAVAQGHEIGNHSLNHPCTGNFPWARHKALEDYTLARMEQELKDANAAIDDLLGVEAVTFAYPCGQTFVGRGRALKSYIPVVAEMFLAGRGWMGEASNDPAFCDRAQLLGMELDGLSFAEAKALIDQARDAGAWLVFAGHDVGEGGRQTVRADTLEAICAYAADPDNGIWIDTVEAVARYVQQTQSAL